MAKPKSPLLSLGAHGTIADTLTFQKRGRDTIAREKPTPRDPYSLPQAYQRWLYKDYAYLWTLQTNAQKQVYRTRASRYHITGFSLWMREHLKDLPDIAAMWHLDNIIGGQVLDSSKNTNHGTVFGATLVDGLISKALSLDGINDYVNCGIGASLQITGPLTIEAQVQLKDDLASNQVIASKQWQSFWLEFHPADLNFYIQDTDLVLKKATYTYAFQGGIPYHIAGTFDGRYIKLLVDGHHVGTDGDFGSQVTIRPSPTMSLLIGAHAPTWYHLGAIIDEVRLYTGVLADTLVKRHSERRYPA